MTITFKAKANRTAEILLYGNVGKGWADSVTVDDFTKQLKGLGDVQLIDLRINSIGGDVFDGMTIYRRLVDHKARVVAHVDGVAASIASVIAMAGDEIVIGESSSMMIHEAWGMAVGNAADFMAIADRLRRENLNIADIYAARTARPREKMLSLMAAETWFHGQEAVDAGLATRVSPNLRIAAHAGNHSVWAAQMRANFIERAKSSLRENMHPGNDDVRAEMESLISRVRASRAAARSRGAGA